MQTSVLFIVTLSVALVLITASPPLAMHLDYEPIVEQEEIGVESPSDRIMYGGQYQVKRACVARGGNCDHRASDCCYSTACRCNLWGANCRCQRKGLFTKLG
ncbi:putative neurotoxin [Rhodnius prolixus]|uniref:putative neurotoxin n=1 Tax=Rhodnius prolixus TaxID=13249 RepID=UPI003D18C454